MRIASTYSRYQQGFSLIELSIVLVILGLLAGGITAGSTLIKNAELRSVVAEMNDLQAGVSAFRLQYSAMPGDMPNAASFWTPAASDAGCNSDAAAMNGNGDGKIDSTVADSSIESYMAWCHMTKSELTTSTLNGQPDDAATAVVPGTNIPRSKLSGAGYWIGYGVHGITTKNALVLGSPTSGGTPTTLITSAALTPRDAQNIDAKLDDGAASTGLVRGFNGSGQTCLAASNYLLSSALVACGIAYNIGL